MKDRVVQFPNRYKMTLVPGTTDIYDLEAAPGVVSEAGTPLSMETLLAAATATALGLAGDPTVDDALFKISQKCEIEHGTYCGNGTYGSTAKNTLTFQINPKVVIIFFNGATAGIGSYGDPVSDDAWSTKFQIFVYGATGFSVFDHNGFSSVTNYAISEKQLSWYNPTNGVRQMNSNMDWYSYICYGER